MTPNPFDFGSVGDDDADDERVGWGRCPDCGARVRADREACPKCGLQRDAEPDDDPLDRESGEAERRAARIVEGG
jgi:hypothetical protein